MFLCLPSLSPPADEVNPNGSAPDRPWDRSGGFALDLVARKRQPNPKTWVVVFERKLGAMQLRDRVDQTESQAVPWGGAIFV